MNNVVQMKKQNLEIFSFGTNFFESKSELSLSAGAMQGAVISNNLVSESFARRYLQRFGNDSQLTFAGYAYDFAVLAAKLSLKVKATQNPSIMALLRGNDSYFGEAMGSYSFRSEPQVGGYFGFPIAIKRVEGERFATVPF